MRIASLPGNISQLQSNGLKDLFKNLINLICKATDVYQHSQLCQELGHNERFRKLIHNFKRSPVKIGWMLYFSIKINDQF